MVHGLIVGDFIIGQAREYIEHPERAVERQFDVMNFGNRVFHLTPVGGCRQWVLDDVVVDVEALIFNPDGVIQTGRDKDRLAGHVGDQVLAGENEFLQGLNERRR